MSPRDASSYLTGAGGLGSAIARQLFAEGARLLIGLRRVRAGAGAIAECRRAGPLARRRPGSGRDHGLRACRDHRRCCSGSRTC